ncbi:UDP-N-acetylmuramate--L-alanine ligase [Candidatus Fermentibacterales bacterium]|nr:UDP-N-acetylmuramate--L-alanine ligase [Candidatus Fermentibacterales bacterium]
MTGRMHLVGIAGSGISALARWYRSLGWQVSGCDTHPGSIGEELSREGIEVIEGHDTSHVEGAQLVVYTAAVPLDHVELERARSLGIRLLRKSEALAELSEGRELIAVAGAHGKTTTCGMIGWALEKLGRSPTVFVGGRVMEWNSNFRQGGDPIVMEADEFDRAFLRIRPSVAVVTSFASEHLECYGNEEMLAQAYGIFLEQTVPGGSVVVPEASKELALWAGRIGRNVRTTGPGGDFDFRKLHQDGKWGTAYSTNLGLDGRIAVPGRHNVMNAATAFAALLQYGFAPEEIIEAISGFPGVSRRLERIGSIGGCDVISDYAHHPEEIEASLRAVRDTCRGPFGVVFEPHLYSRTARLSGDMARALLLADWCLILPVYAAREEPISGVDSDLVCSAARGLGLDCNTAGFDLVGKLIEGRRSGTIVFMGAGLVDELARRLVREAM